MKIVIIDNYDSFTYNLSHLLKELGADVTVLRNDCFELKDLEEFDKIVLSPGPGIPEEAGLLLDVIKEYSGKKPILGVCLGEQAIGEVFGGKLVNLSTVYHGIQSPVDITAVSKEGYIMALRHRKYDVRGIQFHPESVLTPDGKQMIRNWIEHAAQA